MFAGAIIILFCHHNTTEKREKNNCSRFFYIPKIDSCQLIIS